MYRLIVLLLLNTLSPWATAAEELTPRAIYIANMGAMIQRGETKIVFDPLFHYEHNTYDRVPAEVETALLGGIEPWDGIDAVFISHHHGDHFDPATILKLLRAQNTIELFGPEQAAAAIRELIADPEDPLLKRIHGLSLENGMAATDIVFGSLLVEAVRIRHAGWPNRHANVENIVFRVTLDDDTTVMHFGDADVDDAHFAKSPEHWTERHSHLAMPPYWFFLSKDGRRILEERIDADEVIGMHVPADVPDDRDSRPENLKDKDLFTRPGEIRILENHSALSE
jgi:L-ascorbate metabolism protein UlaG (beta-lactamase superfamily)